MLRKRSYMLMSRIMALPALILFGSAYSRALRKNLENSRIYWIPE